MSNPLCSPSKDPPPIHNSLKEHPTLALCSLTGTDGAHWLHATPGADCGRKDPQFVSSSAYPHPWEFPSRPDPGLGHVVCFGHGTTANVTQRHIKCLGTGACLSSSVALWDPATSHEGAQAGPAQNGMRLASFSTSRQESEASLEHPASGELSTPAGPP